MDYWDPKETEPRNPFREIERAWQNRQPASVPPRKVPAPAPKPTTASPQNPKPPASAPRTAAPRGPSPLQRQAETPSVDRRQKLLREPAKIITPLPKRTHLKILFGGLLLILCSSFFLQPLKTQAPQPAETVAQEKAEAPRTQEKTIYQRWKDVFTSKQERISTSPSHAEDTLGSYGALLSSKDLPGDKQYDLDFFFSQIESYKQRRGDLDAQIAESRVHPEKYSEGFVGWVEMMDAAKEIRDPMSRARFAAGWIRTLFYYDEWKSITNNYGRPNSQWMNPPQETLEILKGVCVDSGSLLLETFDRLFPKGAADYIVVDLFDASAKGKTDPLEPPEKARLKEARSGHAVVSLRIPDKNGHETRWIFDGLSNDANIDSIAHEAHPLTSERGLENLLTQTESITKADYFFSDHAFKDVSFPRYYVPIFSFSATGQTVYETAHYHRLPEEGQYQITLVNALSEKQVKNPTYNSTNVLWRILLMDPSHSRQAACLRKALSLNPQLKTEMADLNKGAPQPYAPPDRPAQAGQIRTTLPFVPSGSGTGF